MRIPSRFVRGVEVVLVLGLTGAWLPPSVARADDPRASWLEGRTYEKRETFTSGGKTVEAYVAKLEEADADRETALHRFLVLEGESVAHGYSARVHPVEGQPSRVELAEFVPDVEATNPPIEIATAPSDAAYAMSRRLLEDTLAADPLWRAASTTLEKAIAETEPEGRRPLALAATRVLDRIYAAHPDHIGLLHDLLTSYQLLLPLEAGTDRGANLSFLWRDRLKTAIRMLGEGSDEADDLVGRMLSSCSLAEGCYALAAVAGDFAKAKGHAYGEIVFAEVARLGQDKQEAQGQETLPTPRGELRLAAFRCPEEPDAGGIPFHRMTVLTFGASSAQVPTPVWYSLTCERNGERSRWALYGNVGGTRRLLHLFGASEPASDEVAPILRAQIQAGLDLAGAK